MRIRILKVHTASAAFGRLRYSQQLCVQVRQRWKSEPYLVTRSLSEVLNRDRTERWPASFSLTADFCFQPSLQSPWQGKAETVRQRSRGFRLKKSEHGPPAEVGEEIVRTSFLKAVVVRQRVIHPPEARGDIVGQQHINCIMTPCKKEEYDAT